jgi:UMF1 family MFS transporter
VIPRRAVVSWVVYDLANTIFSMGVVSLYFPELVKLSVGAESADATLSIVQSISYGIIFLLSPLLGAMTDRAGRRMPFLVWSTAISVTATALIARGPFVSAAALFIVANATYQAGLQFYDALLVNVTTPENRGRIGGIGVGVGYIGSFVAIALGRAFAPDHFPTLFLSLALAFLLFALPCFLFVREPRDRPRRQVFGWRVIRESTAETIRTLRSGREYPGLLRFLVGRVFYTDAINTVIGFMALYALNVAAAAGLEPDAASFAKDMIMLGAISCAVPAGFVWGRIADRIGPKRTLDAVLYLWMGTFVLAAAVGAFELSLGWLALVACLAGVGLAGTWSADRPYMLRLAPPHRIGEFYGLYGMVGRFSAITGPALWGLTTYLLVQQSGLPVLMGEAAAILVLLAMIVIGYVILRPVSDAPRHWGDDPLRQP